MEEIKPSNPKDELISKMNNKSLRLSYSALKNFTSPLNFINYKLKPKTSNPSMVFGKLCDVLLLTPDRFEREFSIIPKIPESENQIAFANALIEISKTGEDLTEEIIEVQFKNFYKRGNAFATFELLQDYILAKATGRELITPEIHKQAKEVCENLMLNTDIQLLFKQVSEVQTKLEWTHKGWNFIGYTDMILDNHIIDLKFSKDANPEKFERDILNFDYFLQAGMYCKAATDLGICDNPKYSFIVFDKSMNYSIIELDYSYIGYGIRKYNFLIEELDRCIYEGAFNDSYGFFSRSFKAYKPKWAKSFVLKSDLETSN